MNNRSTHRHLRLADAAAVAFARPDVLISADNAGAAALAEPAATYYGFWNDGSAALFDTTVSPGYVDRTLPTGRQQGPGSPSTISRPISCGSPTG